jgi:S1-C subfamily serine protease
MHGSIPQRIVLGLVVARACLGTAGLRLSAADLQYAFRPGVRFTYTYEIEAELDDKVGLFRGTNAYRVEANAGPGAPGKMVEATGTGFFVAEGHLVTCAHVVNKATRISVHVGTTDLLGKVVGMDLGKDLAVVQVGAKNVPLLPLGDSKGVQLAQNVRVVGFPLASVLGSDTKVTSGTVAGVSERLGRKILQVDASINPGNSGGPLVNDLGEVIGVASAKLAGVQISNVGFAVPVDEVKELLRRHHVSFTSAPPGQPPLPGPEIAKRVSPSVV